MKNKLIFIYLICAISSQLCIAAALPEDTVYGRAEGYAYINGEWIIIPNGLTEESIRFDEFEENWLMNPSIKDEDIARTPQSRSYFIDFLEKKVIPEFKEMRTSIKEKQQIDAIVADEDLKKMLTEIHGYLTLFLYNASAIILNKEKLNLELIKETKNGILYIVKALDTFIKDQERKMSSQ